MGEMQRIITKIKRNVLFIELHSDNGSNSIDNQMIGEIENVITNAQNLCTVVVIEGNENHFCSGADIKQTLCGDNQMAVDPERLYGLWKKFRFGEFVTISHVKGNCTAGGIGFISSSDIVISGVNVQYMLTEMFFNLYPACVLPFLVTKVGIQQANMLTLLCKKVDSYEAKKIGLVDIVDIDSDSATRRCIAQVARHSKNTIRKYKSYMNSLADNVERMQEIAIKENMEMFMDEIAQQKIKNYLKRHSYS